MKRFWSCFVLVLGSQTHFGHAKSIIYNLGEFPFSPFIAVNTFLLNWSLYMCCL